jgi:LysM repeat protein
MADYKVKKGDTLSAIAKSAGTTVKAIQKANPQITNVNLIRPGQVFNIPTKATTPPKTPPSGGTTPPAGGSTEPAPKTSEELAAEDAAKAAAAAAAKEAADKKIQDEKDLASRRDAFAVIKSTLTTYGFTTAEIAELSTFVEAGLTNAKMGPEQLKLDMRELPTYKARFAGNTARVASGMNALSEAEYLRQENDYSEIFKMYGVGNLSSRSQFSTLIGNAVSITEATRRIDTATKRVKNADPAILTNLRNLYPSITDTDIVAYFLKPTEMLPELERKTTVAEISATAKQFGMKETGLARLEDLQAYGVNLAKAREGYETIATELPTATKLSSIYDETGITYGQTEAEQEQFKGSAEAKRKKEKLIGIEKASFSGSSGVGAAGLSTTYLRRGSSAGQF